MLTVYPPSRSNLENLFIQFQQTCHFSTLRIPYNIPYIVIIIKIDNFTMTSIWSRFRAVIYPIMSVCLSIPDQICCKIRNKYFWVHFNGRPNFVTVQNLYWPSVFQDTITNHASSHIVVFSNLLWSHCTVQ